jgi:peptide/nickel transport system substrate-binding protein/oligopeptide transport system substrate-binding protein
MPRSVLAAAILLLAACGSGIPPGIKYYFSADPRSLDPALSTDVPTGESITLLFDNLTQFDTEGRLIPGLATGWWPSADGRTWLFRIRQGVKFHNGRPLDVAAIEASFHRALRMRSEGGRVWPLLPIIGAGEFADGKIDRLEGLVVLDDSTLVFTLEEPLNIFPKLLAMPVAAIVPTPVSADFGEAPIGSGPWRFVSWSHDDLLVFARNDEYWGDLPLADTLRIRIIPEAFTRSAEYESGRLSVVEIPFGETARWQAERADEIQRRPALRALYVAFNTTRGPLTDVRVRQAINHAVNIPAILERVMQGRGILAAGTIPPGLDGYDASRARYQFDPERARSLLSEAGHATGLKLQLWRSARAEYARIAQAIQADLARVGIDLEIVERDASTARSAARRGEADLFLSDWWADYPDGENFTFPLFHSANAGTGGNYAFLSDTVLDRQLERARATPDSQEKVALLTAIDSTVFAKAPWLFCWFPVDLWAMRPEARGWVYPAVFTGQRWTAVTSVPMPP